MIKKDNLLKVLEALKFDNKKNKNIYIKKYDKFNTALKVDFDSETLIYPESDGFIVNERQTCNFKQAENFVVFECVHRLLLQGYNPKHIELEPKWQLGHGASGGRADILIKDNDDKALLIIECKTAGAEFTKAWKTTQVKPTQLFSYVQQIRTTKFMALYMSDFLDEKIKSSYYIISLVDNDILLKNNSELKSYKEASTADEIYEVWYNTYKKDYATIGLFEDTQAYKIGKDKYSLQDLKAVSSKDIQGKYHEFATILRQHNISGRENAFDILVNLFLCKVVDEDNNRRDSKKELKFYWKGIAYDDSFLLQDRLQELYRDGMEKFLNEEITYIKNTEIEKAFSVFKGRPNSIQDTIEKLFKEQKFFTNSDFSFLQVHNEKLFHQNFEVLLKIVKMLQDIKLTGGKEEHQFLGDMFEGFLDQGVKQSEGQFFTPIPIVKFIINSLPIEDIIKEEDNPKSIDYACGAGHFLNEVALHIQKDSYINIYGIEKEYRLSKVAKVSSFMYGQDDINIVYNDALSKDEKIQNDSFSVLVSNPPYSVKGFLETLSNEERKEFELTSSIEEKSYTVNNSIECFFVERAKQLLKAGGVAGIILPSSILSKGDNVNTYVKTREIIIKYFDIIAIAEFGSGTFGKTGTNTVTLFLRRKDNNPDIQKHLKYMVASWFNGDFTTNDMFKNKDLLEKYCTHCKLDFEIYKSFLSKEKNENLYTQEIFKEYKNSYDKSSVANKKKTTLEKYIRVMEEDKLYYFCMASLNKKEVIIVKAPNDGKENKKFLGYEWSGRKGDEGIQYNSGSINTIQIPLYNPSNKKDENKINTLISSNFSNADVNIPQSLEKFVSKARLVDMLDFSRSEFNKALSLNPSKKVEVESKWDLVKLGDYINDNPKSKIKVLEVKENDGKYKFFTSGIKIYNYDSYLVENKNIYLSTGGNAIVYFFDGKASYSTDTYSFKTANSLKIEYLHYYLQSIIKYINENLFQGVGLKHLQKNDFRNIKIPLPPLKIQEQIVRECKEVDDEVLKANNIIEKSKIGINNYFQDILTKANKTFKLSDEKVFNAFIGRRILQKELSEDKTGIPIYSANVFDIFGYINKEFIKDFSFASVLWGIDGDWMVRHMPENKPFYPTDHCGVINIKNDEIHPKYLTWALNKAGEEVKFSRTYRASTNRVKGMIIKAPSKAIQDDMISKIEILESKISEATQVINNAKELKENILKKYLN